MSTSIATPKLIREIRMGPPKTWKTGCVVGTYPKPMLVLEGDEGGLDIVRQPIEWVAAAEFDQWLTKHGSALPSITAVQFAHNPDLQLADLFGPVPDRTSFPEFNLIGNSLFKHKPCPFHTVVIDPITMLSNSILSYFSMTNARKMEDARKWAGAVGQKTVQTMSAFMSLKCHVVCIMHTATNKVVNEKGEITSITEEPVIYSKSRDMIGSLSSQFFYQDSITVSDKRKVFIRTCPDSRIRGIGARWPENLPAQIDDPTFDRIYGESVKKGEVVI